MNRKIIVDSSANLYAGDLPDFVPVALKILAGEREYVDDDRLDVPAMVKELREYKGKSSTACPGVGDWLDAFGDAEEIFAAALTSKLSGCYNAGSIAAGEYQADYPGRKVFLLDSLSTGPELELLAEKCSELSQTDASFEEICQQVQEYSRRTHLMFSLESLSNFAKNGRVSPALAAAANLLGIRIVGRASAQGDLEPMNKCRGETRALLQLWVNMRSEGYAGGKVRIRHSNNPRGAVRMADQIRAIYPNCDLRIGENRGLCSYYAEEGGLLVGFEGA